MKRKIMSSTLIVMFFSLLAAASASSTPKAIQAKLESFASVPTLARKGTGEFKAHIKRKQGKIRYVLTYSGLDSGVLQSHIHFGNAWENGGVSAFLCTNLGNAPVTVPNSPPPCPSTEGQVHGVIEAGDVIGPGGERGIQPGDFDALLDAISAGATYVNVHTNDFPPGEIRGQIR